MRKYATVCPLSPFSHTLVVMLHCCNVRLSTEWIPGAVRYLKQYSDASRLLEPPAELILYLILHRNIIFMSYVF